MNKLVAKKFLLPFALGAIPAGLIFGASDAKAVLVYEFIQQGSDVRVDVSGSLSGLPSGISGDITSGFGEVYTGTPGVINFGSIVSGTQYSGSGPNNFGSITTPVTMTGFSVTPGVYFEAISKRVFLSSSYVQGTPISGSGLLTGKTLSSLGLNSTSGLLGTWTFGSDTIEVWAGPKSGGSSAAAAPGPLPLLGAGAAFAYSRRLRSRLRGGRPSLKA